MNQIFAGAQRFLLVVLVILALTSLLSAYGSNTTFDTIEDLKNALTTNPKQLITGDGELLIYLTRSNGQTINDVNVGISVDASGMKAGNQKGMAVKRGNGLYLYPMKFHMRTNYDVHLWIFRNGNVIATQESTITV